MASSIEMILALWYTSQHIQLRCVNMVHGCQLRQRQMGPTDVTFCNVSEEVRKTSVVLVEDGLIRFCVSGAPSHRPGIELDVRATLISSSRGSFKPVT